MKIIKSGTKLQDTIAALDNPKPLLEEVGEILKASTIARILFTKQDPNGKAWAPWATSTLLSKTKRGTLSGGLLNETGALANSIKTQVASRQVTVGSDSPYGMFLQEGTSRMPARPFIGISKEDQSEIHEAMVKFFKKAAK